MIFSFGPNVVGARTACRILERLPVWYPGSGSSQLIQAVTDCVKIISGEGLAHSIPPKCSRRPWGSGLNSRSLNAFAAGCLYVELRIGEAVGAVDRRNLHTKVMGICVIRGRSTFISRPGGGSFGADWTSYQPHEAKRSDVLIFVLVNKPLIVPNLEPGVETGENVETMGSRDCERVIVMFDVVSRADIVAMVKEVNPIEGHVFR